MFESLAGLAVRHRGWSLIVAGLVALATVTLSPYLPFDRAIENMFPPGDSRLAPYQLLKDRFGGNEVVLIVYRDDGLFAPDGTGIERLERITAAVEAVEGVGGVMSLSRLNAQLEQTFGTSLLDEDADQPQRVKALFTGFTHGEDGQTAAVVAMLDRASVMVSSNGGVDGRLTGEVDPRRRIIADIRAAVASLPQAPEVMLAGEPVMVAEGFRYVEEDGGRLGWMSSLLLALVIAACFRSIRWIVIPLAVVQWALLMTKASLAIAGMRLSMVSTMLTAIVTVVGVAAVMHVIVAYRQRLTRLDEGHATDGPKPPDSPTSDAGSTFRSTKSSPAETGSLDNRDPADPRAGATIRQALLAAMVMLAPAVVWSCLTDALGFASLVASDVGPVQDFGWMMAVGSLWVFPAVVLLVPGLALLPDFEGWLATRIRAILPRPVAAPLTFLLHAVPQHAFQEDTLRRGLVGLLPVVRRLRWPILVGTLAIVGVLGWQTTHQRVETDFTRNFRDSSELARSYAFIEEHLGGAGVWDIVLPVPEQLDAAYLRQVRQIENRLLREVTYTDAAGETQPGLTKVISLVDGLDAVSPVDLTRTPRFLGNAPIRVALGKMRDAMPQFTDALYVPPDDRAVEAERSSDEPGTETETAAATTDANATGDTTTGDNTNQPESGPRRDAPTSSERDAEDLVARYHPPGGAYRVMLRSLERLDAETKRSIIRQVEAIIDEETAKLWYAPLYRQVNATLQRLSPRSDPDIVVTAIEEAIRACPTVDSEDLISRFRDQWAARQTSPVVHTAEPAADDRPASFGPPEGTSDDGSETGRAAETSPERVQAETPPPRSRRNAAPVVEALTAALEDYNRAQARQAPVERQGFVTGFYILLARLIESLLRDQVKAFLIASAGIFLAMWAALRDVRLALAALVPNILPIVVVLGGTAALGWKINLGAVMIAAVSIGLSIDSSVHYLMSFRRARQRGDRVLDALGEAQQGAGRSITFATLALVAGFASLSTSAFMPTASFGYLTALTMLGGMIGNLIILPTLVMVLIPDRADDRVSWEETPPPAPAASP